MSYIARWLGRHKEIDSIIASLIVNAFEKDAAKNYRRQ